MNGGFDFGANWAAVQASSDVLIALSFLSIFVALCLVAARREAAKYRRTLIIFAFFVLFAGVGRIWSLSPAVRFQSWWTLATALLSVLTAAIIIANLPRYLRLPKIAEELRGQ